MKAQTMSDQDEVWGDLRKQAEDVGVENAASLTTEQLRKAIDERHTGTDRPSQTDNQANDQQR
jgi:hypothetical protein